MVGPRRENVTKKAVKKFDTEGSVWNDASRSGLPEHKTNEIQRYQIMKNQNLLTSLAVGVGLACSLTAAQAAVVYNNFTTSQNLNYYPAPFTGGEVGDQVILNTAGIPLFGGMAKMESFKFNVAAKGYTANPTINAQVRFYANDGGFVGLAQMPGTKLWESTVFPITIQDSGGGPVGPGDTTYYSVEFTSDVMGLLVPGNFTWTVQFSNLGAGEAGLQLYGPPSVGNGYTDYWLNVSPVPNVPVWTLWGPTNPNDPDYSFGAMITAVPEPGSMLTMACIVGVGGLVAWRRRAKA